MQVVRQGSRRALRTSCPGAVRWHKLNTSPDTTLKVLFYEMLHDLGLTDEIPPWYSPVKSKPVYESVDVQAYWDVPMFAEHQEMRSRPTEWTPASSITRARKSPH